MGVRKVARFRQQQEARSVKQREQQETRSAKQRHPEEVLLLRLQRILKAWDHSAMAEKRRLRLECARRQREHEALTKKRRWDGKESFDEFQRRVQAPRDSS